MASRRRASRAGRTTHASRLAGAAVRARRWLAHGPTRLAVIGAVALAVLIAASLDTDPQRQTDAESGTDAALANAPDKQPPDTAADDGGAGEPAAPSSEQADAGESIAAEPVERRVGPERDWQYVQVASGDTMEIIFRRLGLSPRLLHEVVHLDERTAGLVDLRPGDEIAFEIDDDDELLALRAEYDDERWLFVERGDGGLTSRLEARNIEVRMAEVEAEITSSLFNAGKNAGLTDNMILRLAGIFGWDIDFALDIRRGDRFALVFEEIYRDGQFLRQGAIVAARFVNRGESFEAIRFDAGDGPDYYAPDGRPMRKQFLRAPINFTRVSSNFNPRRLHPVTRRIRPHNGTDYAAPTGTPVWAAGDGTVIEAGYTRANGNYIFLKHGNHIVTRYLHLSKKHVSRGDRVRQGQTIGRVGATGLATGPHLHYEFLVHGRHRDPRTVDLPEAEPLPEAVLPEFKAHAEPWLAKLERLIRPDVMLASSDGDPATETDASTAASE
jgi:murein DD-endopeptidase MepM/ murein hydrolase activator NlpD